MELLKSKKTQIITRNKMSSKTIKKHLELLKSEKKYDEEFIEMLRVCNEENKEGEIVAENVIETINNRYAESKKDKT